MQEDDNVINHTDLTISKDKIRDILRQTKNNEAFDPDEWPAEIIKLFDEDNLTPLEVLFNKMYCDGHYPANWIES